MKLEELKHGLEQSSPEDKVYLAAYLRHLVRRDDASHQAAIAARREDMASGKKFSLEQLQRVSRSLEAEGL
jgi:hypothetical protein